MMVYLKLIKTKEELINKYLRIINRLPKLEFWGKIKSEKDKREFLFNYLSGKKKQNIALSERNKWKKIK